jgi:hypothetical protein
VRAWAGTLNAPETRRAYVRDVAGFLRHLGIARDGELLGVRPPRVAAWRDVLAGELEAGRLSYQSCKRRLSAASSLYDYLNVQGHVVTNPVRRVKRVPPPEAERQRDRRRRAACPARHCPVAGGPAAGNSVPDLIGSLIPGRQLTLW